jgi:hypothetical protein
MPTPKPARSVAPNPQPIQFTPFTLDHFKTPEGLAFVNQFFAQIVNQQNRSVGTAGPVVLPAGINVAGSTVTGLGTPTGPTDAVSSGHAEANYGASSTAKALDIGGTNTLKGLASVYQSTQNNAPLIAAIPGIQAVLKPGVSGTLTIPKLTTANGSLTFVDGIITSYVEPT